MLPCRARDSCQIEQQHSTGLDRAEHDFTGIVERASVARRELLTGNLQLALGYGQPDVTILGELEVRALTGSEQPRVQARILMDGDRAFAPVPGAHQPQLAR